jgi:type VI secretion system protein ImpH
MSAPKRQHGPGLIDQLFAEPHRFEFFQAVRLIERTLADAPRGRGDLVPRELSFRSSVSLGFAPSEIEALRVTHAAPDDAPAEGDAAPAEPAIERIEITPAFMSLLGVSGTLPLVYTEHIVQRETQQKDFAARAFLDIFGSRAVSLFYAAWKKHRLHLHYEADQRNRFAPLVLALGGLGQGPLLDRLKPEAGGVADESLAFFAGALQQRQLSASQIERLLARYLNVSVRIEQFLGRWYDLPPSARTSLGLGNGVLGRNALSGERVWQRDLRVKVTLGPLGHDKFRRFLPGAPGALALKELLTLLSGVSLEYEINLELKAEAIETSQLSSTRSPLAGRLGWDTYLQSQPAANDRCDVRYDIHGAAA